MNITQRPALSLNDLDRAALEAVLAGFGAKKIAGGSVFLTLSHDRGGALPGRTPALWSRLLAAVPLSPAPAIARRVSARDGTVKVLLEFPDGAPAECVVLPGKGRFTACISSQSGCACGCAFCATGALGLRRDLRPSEITAQFSACLAEAGGRLDSVVFMGMGEPFLNWTNVKTAVSILSDGKAFAFSQGKMTVSTVGIIPVIDELAASDLKLKLAISVVTAVDAARAKLVPMQAKYPLRDVLAAARRYCAARKAQVFAEYILFEGVNDSPADAAALIAALEGLPCRVNIIPWNSPAGPAAGDPAARAKSFQKILIDAGLRTYLRLEKGSDIMAACGQLAAKSAKLT